MRIFAIRDGNANVPKDLAYLFYYEKDKTFYIELPEGADEWETPLLLSSFVKRGETTVNPYWSRTLDRSCETTVSNCMMNSIFSCWPTGDVPRTSII